MINKYYSFIQIALGPVSQSPSPSLHLPKKDLSVAF